MHALSFCAWQDDVDPLDGFMVTSDEDSDGWGHLGGPSRPTRSSARQQARQLRDRHRSVAHTVLYARSQNQSIPYCMADLLAGHQNALV